VAVQFPRRFAPRRPLIAGVRRHEAAEATQLREDPGETQKILRKYSGWGRAAHHRRVARKQSSADANVSRRSPYDRWRAPMARAVSTHSA